VQDIQIICIYQYIIEISCRGSSVVEGVHSHELNHDPCSDTLDIHIDQAGLYAGFRDDGLHLAGDVVEPIVSGG